MARSRNVRRALQWPGDVRWGGFGGGVPNDRARFGKIRPDAAGFYKLWGDLARFDLARFSKTRQDFWDFPWFGKFGQDSEIFGEIIQRLTSLEVFDDVCLDLARFKTIWRNLARFNRPHQRLPKFDKIWADQIRQDLGIFATIWHYLARLGKIWQNLIGIAEIRQELATSGGIFRRLALFAEICPDLAIFGRNLLHLAIFGWIWGIWQNLTEFDRIWQDSEIFAMVWQRSTCISTHWRCLARVGAI